MFGERDLGILNPGHVGQLKDRLAAAILIIY